MLRIAPTTSCVIQEFSWSPRFMPFVEFAFEIGSSLLTEVRRLQSLLAERDKALQDMKEEKDDLDKLVENLTTGLRTQKPMQV